MKHRQRLLIVWGLVLLLLVISSCAPGNERYDVKPAGFWVGLWHGFICVVTFIISLFSETVRMYEVNNTGGWYNFGFLLGVAILFGGSCGSGCKSKKGKERDWDEIGEKVEAKVRKGIQSWLDEPDKKKKEWEEIGRKIEEKIKRELRDWAEK